MSMLIDFKTQDIDFAGDMNELLCQLDDKIMGMTSIKLDTARYGGCDHVDLNRLFILKKYKDILIMKAAGSSCLSNYFIDDIISNIKQYLTSGVIQKFKPFSIIFSNTNLCLSVLS